VHLSASQARKDQQIQHADGIRTRLLWSSHRFLI
jgi:hypothetical protein